MRVFCDENVKFSLYNLLRQEGHDCVRIEDTLGKGASDEEIAEYCREENRLILTSDDDFLTLTEQPGIIFLNEQTTSSKKVANSMRRIEASVDEPEKHVFYVPGDWV